MIFRQLLDYDTFTYTYLIASGIGREAVLIDPVKTQTDKYLQLIKELDLKLVYAIDTHVHADHITALGALCNVTQCQSVMGEQSKAECLSLHVKDNENIKIDSLILKAIYTPGHTDDSYSFVMDDRVFTGDTLLIRGTGRTDFQNGDSEQQYDSLFNKLLALPENVLVYPAHDYNGRTVSTIGEEKQFNPRLQVKSIAEYVELMANLNLPNPKYMDIAVPANLKCGNN
jgi:glyoxylase-like metal-dependent hydrolase (beta-lactamase superfamily II)